MPRHALIRAGLQALAKLGAARWLPAAADASGFVVTLHHVTPARAAAFDLNALLSVTPEFLDSFLAHFLRKGWRFVSLDELVAPAEGRTDPRRIAVTLDDGYRDNLEHAWPVFRRHDTPFTIFVCPGFTDRTSELWWEALERIIADTDSVAAPGQGRTRALTTQSPAQKSRAFRQWTQWLTTEANETEQRVAIRALSEKHRLNLRSLARQLVMDWDEVRTIAADRLCTIGAHTMTHPALARLSPQAAFREMEESATRIEAEIGKRPTSIAFPYGYPAAAGLRERELAKQAWFLSSFTTQPGYISATGSRHGLPRVSLNGLFQDLRFTEVLLSPGLWTLRKRVRRRR